MKKLLMLGIVIFIGAFGSYLLLSANQPVDALIETRGEVVKNIENIKSIDGNNGTMIYSVGEVNNGEDYMYFVDLVRKPLTRYKWVGGGGHINRNIVDEKPYVLSLQLLNEEQNIEPTILGVLKDSNVKDIDVKTDKIAASAGFYPVKNDETFYVVRFKNDVAKATYFRVKATYTDGSLGVHIIPRDRIADLQEGKVFYLKKEDFIKE